VLTLDAIGERYGMLPSEVMQKATTFDLFIFDAAVTYRNMLQDKADGKHKNVVPTTAELVEKLARHKKKKDDNKDKSNK